MRFFSPARNTAARGDFVGRTQDTARRGTLAAIVVAAASIFAMSTLTWHHASSAEQLQSSEELQATEEPQPAEQVPSAEQVLSAGRIVKVDIGAGKITIDHKPISRFHLESMTRIFRVKDPTMLTALTPGDKIRFRVERGDDGFIVTDIENSN
jgi:Cu/Ag efflux protein CusF